MDRLGELARLLEVRRRRLAPDQVGVRRVGEPARDRRLDARADAVEALRRALAGEERAVALVDVAGEQRRRVGVGARDEERRHVQRRRPRGARRRACGRTGPSGRAPCRPGGRTSSRHASWSSKWTPAAPASIIGLHQLEGVERAAEAGLGVGDDRRRASARSCVALGPLDLVGAQERVVDAPHERGHAVRRVEALVGVDVAREVRVGRDLPAGEVDRLQAGLHHLHGLAAGERAERVDVVLGRAGAARAAPRRAARACARSAPSRAAGSPLRPCSRARCRASAGPRPTSAPDRRPRPHGSGGSH